jgi:hypothetical protein
LPRKIQVENVRQPLGLDPATRVGDLDPQPVEHHSGAHHDLGASRRDLPVKRIRRVLEQIQKHLV